jgi:pre-mRNA-splicing factor 38B
MEIHGSKETFNVENVLRQNIVNSDYYRNTCMQLTCWEEIIDEIYESVQHVEPWMSGNARGASSAFCLLYRLFSVKMAPAELRQTLDHKDSPYIRAVRVRVGCAA